MNSFAGKPPDVLGLLHVARLVGRAGDDFVAGRLVQLNLPVDHARAARQAVAAPPNSWLAQVSGQSAIRQCFR